MKTTKKFGAGASVQLPLGGRKAANLIGKQHPGEITVGKSLATKPATKHRVQHTPADNAEILEVKSKMLAAAVANEFGTALNKIILSAELIDKYYDTLNKQNILNEVTGIKTAAMYMAAIIKDFRFTEQIDKNMMQPAIAAFDLKDLTEAVVGQMKHQTKDWQDIKYKHTGSSSIVSLDKELLQHCLVNLISNAIKYSDAADHIEVGSEISGDTCKVWVKDYGIGIPEEEIERLFEPFFRAKNALHVQGTGLGLNLVKRYTELMGGKVTVKKNTEKGTVVYLEFPITPWHRTHKPLNKAR